MNHVLTIAGYIYQRLLMPSAEDERMGIRRPLESMQEEIVGILASMINRITRVHIEFEAGVLSRRQMQYLFTCLGRVHLGLSVLGQEISYDEQSLSEIERDGDPLQISKEIRRLERSIPNSRAELARNRKLLARLASIPPDPHIETFNALFTTLNEFDKFVDELHELTRDCEGGGGRVEAARSQKLSWDARRLAQDALYSESPDLKKAHMGALRLKKQVAALVDAQLN